MKGLLVMGLHIHMHTKGSVLGILWASSLHHSMNAFMPPDEHLSHGTLKPACILEAAGAT